jgi:hypothetical protein
MLFLIFWETYPDKLQEVFKLAKEGKLSTPPGVKTIEEYGTPEGLYVEIVETDNEEALYKYVISLLPYHRNVEVKLAFPAKDILSLF